MSPPKTLAAAALMFVAASAAFASDHGRHLRPFPTPADRVAPIEQALETVHREVPGTVVAIELESKRMGWVYDIDVVRADGSRARLRYDARTLTQLQDRTGR